MDRAGSAGPRTVESCSTQKGKTPVSVARSSYRSLLLMLIFCTAPPTPGTYAPKRSRTTSSRLSMASRPSPTMALERLCSLWAGTTQCSSMTLTLARTLCWLQMSSTCRRTHPRRRRIRLKSRKSNSSTRKSNFAHSSKSSKSPSQHCRSISRKAVKARVRQPCHHCRRSRKRWIS